LLIELLFIGFNYDGCGLLLTRHEDAHEAVPWYQGIELFLALRRLEKPVWMINYNDEPHNLVRRANRVDWAIRMQITT